MHAFKYLLHGASAAQCDAHTLSGNILKLLRGQFRINRTPPYGGGPFVLCPELYDEKVTTGNTGSILGLRSGHKTNSFLAIQTLPVFPVVIYSEQA